jgi:hypothetical protein
MKTISGHLTPGNKKAIKAILNAGLTEGRVNSSDYFLTKENDVYKVKIQKMDRGLIPCPGSSIRKSTYISTFTI